MSELPKFMGTNIRTQNQRLIMVYVPINPKAYAWSIYTLNQNLLCKLVL